VLVNFKAQTKRTKLLGREKSWILEWDALSSKKKKKKKSAFQSADIKSYKLKLKLSTF